MTSDAGKTYKRGKITDWLEELGKGNEDLMEDSVVDVDMEVTMMEVLNNHEVIASFERDKRKERARVQKLMWMKFYQMEMDSGENNDQEVVDSDDSWKLDLFDGREDCMEWTAVKNGGKFNECFDEDQGNHTGHY